MICPCTASLAFGATLDRCRVTLVFRVRGGKVKGTDVSGLGRRLFGADLGWDASGRWFAGGVLTIAALYELTPLENVCLAKVPQPARIPPRRLA